MNTGEIVLQLTLKIIEKYPFAELVDGLPQKLKPKDAAEATAEIYNIIYRKITEYGKD
ncbi:MAG: hypothetical protein K6T65_01405 [Peptococcaceae bacterium]|nr:hypothetical protein [Peptococcaceae bacterium]